MRRTACWVSGFATPSLIQQMLIFKTIVLGLLNLPNYFCVWFKLYRILIKTKETIVRQVNVIISLKFFCLFPVYLLHNVVHGSQATPVYTLMLRCSQNAPPSIRTACYSFLGTLEILGKQFSLFMAGVLTEGFGYVAAFHISLAVSLFVVILVWCCPRHLRWKPIVTYQSINQFSRVTKFVSCQMQLKFSFLLYNDAHVKHSRTV